MIQGTPGHVEKIKKHDYFMQNQTHPVSHIGETISRRGENMKDKLIDSFGTDSVTKNVYTRHPVLYEIVKPVGKGAERLEGTEDTKQA